MYGTVSHIIIYQNVCIKIMKPVFYFCIAIVADVALLAEMNYRIKQQLNKKRIFCWRKELAFHFDNFRVHREISD